MRAPLALLAVGVLAWAQSGSAAAVPPVTLAPPNPHLGPVGTSTMHGDAGSSDATPLPGPGPGPHPLTVYPLAAACPTLLQGHDGLVVALCTSIATRTPTVYLLDPAAPGPVGAPLAALELAKGSLLGGVYAYLDDADRLVAVDGERALLRIAHDRDADGRHRLWVDERTDLRDAVPTGDNVTGLVADWSGRVWFATGGGVVGAVFADGRAVTVTLPEGERVANSISAAPGDRVAVATTHALYEFGVDAAGSPRRLWRAPYDRGSARRPGQLSWGTGSTPTYFGPRTGSEYVTVVDNADGGVRALVFRSGSGERICAQPVLGLGGPGSENSPVGAGGSVIVASTYGYPYPAVPDDAGPAAPPQAPFTGGSTRIDVDDTGCRTVWESPVRSAAVPHLSVADGLLYTLTRVGAASTTPLDGFAFTVIDPESGEVISSTPLPGTVVNDPIQMSPLLATGGRLWQGTVTGILRLG